MKHEIGCALDRTRFAIVARRTERDDALDQVDYLDSVIAELELRAERHKEELRDIDRIDNLGKKL